MPKSFSRSVRWDTRAWSYQFSEQIGSTIKTVDLDFQSAGWQHLLEQVSSFAFQSRDGYHFTARKEARARGNVYWIAYRKLSGKLAHKYLGRTTDVTLSRLEQVAAALAGQVIQTQLSKHMDGQRQRSVQEPFAEQLLSTKFFIPTSSHVLVPRPRLSTLLDEGLQRSLTIVSAPAGFGKTTLLSAWVQTLPKETAHVAWVSLDEQDSDPVRFWMYVLTALDRVQPGAYSDLLARLRTRPDLSLSSLPTALINRLAQSQQQMLLVLDNVHVIGEERLLMAFATSLGRLPPQVHVILSTRIDPPLPLSRLRARGQLLEVRAEQLRCTDTEIEDFFREVVGIELEHFQLQQVDNKSEGWLAGLQILGLSLSRHCVSSSIQEEMSGSHRHIVEYLSEEVLCQQPPAVLHFLLRTSLLERFTAPLCDAVLGRSDSLQMLDRLKRANLFLIPLDSQRRWYRYHTLFAEMLRSLLEQSDPEAIMLVHRRASAWYAGHGYVDEAIQHAIGARDWSLAADLIAAKIQMPGRGKWEEATAQCWIERLPPQVARSHPRLCLVSALPRPNSSPTVDIRPEPAAEPVVAPDIAAKRLIRANRTALQNAPQQDLLDPLSLRELEVLHLMAQGATNGEIALTLTLAVETIKRHVSNILSKLGVSNRTQAAARAYDLGLLLDYP